MGQIIGRITGLSPGTGYYVRAYATNIEGTSYSISELVLTPLTVTQASLATLAPESITPTSVVSGGDINNTGGGEILEKGICWSTDPSPTIENSRAIAGAGSENFTIKLTSLDPGKTYFLRAYAINSAGVSYGPEISFSTPASLVIMSTGFPGDTKYHTVTFSIDNKIYMGLGSADWWDYWPTGDFWEWDQANNKWTRLAQYPGSISNPIGFSVGGKGYIFTNSLTPEDDPTNELWEYDPAANLWTQKSSLPSSVRRFFPSVFSIGSKGYIGLGRGTQVGSKIVNYNDFWEWDQATDVWSRKADFPGPGRYGAASFAMGNRGYIGTGAINWDEPLEKDFWEYDQTSDSWTRKADFAGAARAYAIGFSIGNKGYIGAGQWVSGPESGKQEFWEWDPVMDKWTMLGIVDEPVTIMSGGSAGNNGYFITDPISENRQVELWILPLISDK